MLEKRKASVVRAYINECDGIRHIKDLKFLNTSLDVDVITLDHRDININIVNNNVRIMETPIETEIFCCIKRQSKLKN